MSADWIKRVPPGSTVVAAVSGGADSVWLAHLLKDLGMRHGFGLAIAHVNHGVRGEASDRDEGFVRAFASRLEVPCHVASLGPHGAVDAGGQGAPDENDLRHFRLAALKQIARRIGTRFIAFGHQRDDLAETFLLNALRGSGPAGLEAMRAWRETPDGFVFLRPLLLLRRRDIEGFLRERGQRWCEDETNAGRTHRRNILRHDILPALERVESAAVENIATSGEFCGEILQVYTRQVGLAAGRVTLAEGPGAVLLSVPPLRGELDGGLVPGILRACCARLASAVRPDATTPMQPDRERLRDLVSRLHRDSGEESDFSLGNNVHASVTNRFLLVYTGCTSRAAALAVRTGYPFLLAAPEEARQWPVANARRALLVDFLDLPPYAFEVYLHERQFDAAEYQTGAEENRAFFDLDRLPDGFGIGPVPPDERLPLPGEITKTARECLRERGVPPRLRTIVAGVRDGSGTLWIPGIRRTSRAWITAETHRVLEIRVSGKRSHLGRGTNG